MLCAIDASVRVHCFATEATLDPSSERLRCKIALGCAASDPELDRDAEVA